MNRGRRETQISKKKRKTRDYSREFRVGGEIKRRRSKEGRRQESDIVCLYEHFQGSTDNEAYALKGRHARAGLA